MDERPFSATDLLSVTITVAGFAIALAALRPDSLAVVPFLAAGLFSTAGSLYAMAALLDEAGVTWNHLKPSSLLRGERPERLGTARFVALLCATVGVMILVGAYIALLFDTFF